MSTLRLAILKEVKQKDGACIMLEYSEEQMLEKLKSGIVRQLLKTETWHKKKWSRQEVLYAMEKSWEDLVTEFKGKTITLL